MFWKYVLLVAIGIAGVVLGRHLAVRRQGLVARQSDTKRKNKKRILEELYFRKNQGQEARITNDEIQAMVGISHATATRYFDELEADGVIVQVGTVGQQVYYELSPE